jgi:hypothetical protein
VNTVIKWGLSPLDWRNHAVDEWADHPIGVYRAQCGHLLMIVTALLAMPLRQAVRGMCSCFAP